MERLIFDFSGDRAPNVAPAPTVVGVVGSGNLEVLVEPAELNGGCRIEVLTAAMGFGHVWRAVLADFVQRHCPGDLRISINDVGATPAVVSLRLDQAMEALKAGGAP